VFLRNVLQRELSKRFYGFKPDSSTMDEWIARHAEDFGKLIAENPGLIERFSSERDAVLAEIEDKLYARAEKKSDAA
jgi:hypothetical protein